MSTGQPSPIDDVTKGAGRRGEQPAGSGEGEIPQTGVPGAATAETGRGTMVGDENRSRTFLAIEFRLQVELAQAGGKSGDEEAVDPSVLEQLRGGLGDEIDTNRRRDAPDGTVAEDDGGSGMEFFSPSVFRRKSEASCSGGLDAEAIVLVGLPQDLAVA